MLSDNPNDRFIFAMTDQGQFDVKFAIYRKDKIEDEN